MARYESFRTFQLLNVDNVANTLIGHQASANNTAVGHVSVGIQAGFNCTNAAGNTLVGYRAGYENTSGGLPA